AGANRVIEECGMHRLAHWIVAAEGERHVADAAAHERMRQSLLDLPCRLDVADAVAVVLLDAGRDGKYIRIEDDVLGGKADHVGEQAVGARTDGELAVDGLPLAAPLERHDDNSGA